VRRGRLAALALPGLLAGCGAGEPPLSAVLITLDTTNREALGCYGQRLPLTPNLDRIAGEGLVFEVARTVAPLTLPAHASLLTGLVPLRHGVRDNALVPLPAAAETLAERLSAAGFQTAAFVSAVVLAAPSGLDQGFARYDAPRGSQAGGPTAHMLERSATDTVRAAVEWLRARDRARPFFLWVHGFEPHDPYVPPSEFLARAQGDPYLAEVAALDHALGALLEALEREHGLERLVLVVAADHGEALGDHGERTHSVLCYERVLRVPLLVRLPGRERAGERVATSVGVVDVAPTFLDALGLRVPPGLDGESLLEPARGRGTYFESMTGYLNYGWSPLAGWVAGSWKYLHGTAPELYDLARDPLESVNLLGERAAEAERARGALAELAARPRLDRGGARSSAELEALAADVRALGYAGAATGESPLVEPLAETGLPAPRERMDELERFYRAVLRHNHGKTEQAIADLEALTAENPLNATALNVLATCYYAEQRLREALATLRRIPEHARERVTVQDLLGHCLEQLGEREQARVHFERALALKPGDPHQQQDLERVREPAPPR
jgi:arylsulfatase A-like enzyme